MRMKKIEIGFLKMYNFIIGGLIAILGFAASCETKTEYGVPHAKFILKGTVESSLSIAPIQKIRVIMQGNSSNTSSDTAFTDASGNYAVSDGGFPANQTYIVRFDDIDSILNGAFDKLDTTVEFNDPKFINGDGPWYSGETSKELDIKLHPKK